MTTSKPNLERIESLEVQLSFQEETISQLNDALAEQQQQLLQLKEVLSLMQTKMASLADAVDSTRASHEGHELPPHY